MFHRRGIAANAGECLVLDPVTGPAVSEQVKEELVLGAEGSLVVVREEAASAVVGILEAGDEHVGGGVTASEGAHGETVTDLRGGCRPERYASSNKRNESSYCAMRDLASSITRLACNREGYSRYDPSVIVLMG